MHASVGFDARFGIHLHDIVDLDGILLGGGNDLVDDLVQVVPDGGSPVEGGVHLHEVWSELHSEAAPQVSRVTGTLKAIVGCESDRITCTLSLLGGENPWGNTALAFLVCLE